MTIVYSRIQANNDNYREKISKELDEDSKGLEFDFNNNDDNAINVEYSGKLIALVEKQEGDYIIERVSGTPQPSEVITSETEHGAEQLEELKDKKGSTNQNKTINIDKDTQKPHTGTGGDVIRLEPKKDNIIRVNFG